MCARVSYKKYQGKAGNGKVNGMTRNHKTRLYTSVHLRDQKHTEHDQKTCSV